MSLAHFKWEKSGWLKMKKSKLPGKALTLNLPNAAWRVDVDPGLTSRIPGQGLCSITRGTRIPTSTHSSHLLLRDSASFKVTEHLETAPRSLTQDSLPVSLALPCSRRTESTFRQTAKC